MSGNLLLSSQREPDLKHTHATWIIDTDEPQKYLHFVDPRRFGCVLCCSQEELSSHKLLKDLGPEPLTTDNLAEHLWGKSRNKVVAVKNFLMDARIVVGVGNIYANEALFRAHVRPTRKAKSIKRSEWDFIASSIKEVLHAAIAAGGTSFRDYKHVDGGAGYFEVALQVYGRESEPCSRCGTPISLKKLGGRATYYCSACQL
jgi:formamidopyrimidine-DNA glycosylase